VTTLPRTYIYFVLTTARIPNVRSWKIIVFWVVTPHNICVPTFCLCHQSILILSLFFLRPLFPFLSSFLFILISLWLHNSPFPILNTSLTLQPDSQSSTTAAKVSLSCIQLFWSKCGHLQYWSLSTTQIIFLVFPLYAEFLLAQVWMAWTSLLMKNNICWDMTPCSLVWI
jgi:hypothetical protein